MYVPRSRELLATLIVRFVHLGYFQGSIFVTANAKEFLQSKRFSSFPSMVAGVDSGLVSDLMKGSRFELDIPYITRVFDKTTKLRFRTADEPQFIKFGTLRDKDVKLNIRSGQLKLLGSVSLSVFINLFSENIPRSDVASFFDPAIQCILQSVEEQCRASPNTISVRLLSFLPFRVTNLQLVCLSGRGFRSQ